MGSIPEWQEFSRSGAKPPFAHRSEEWRLPTQNTSLVGRYSNDSYCREPTSGFFWTAKRVRAKVHARVLSRSMRAAQRPPSARSVISIIRFIFHLPLLLIGMDIVDPSCVQLVASSEL